MDLCQGGREKRGREEEGRREERRQRREEATEGGEKRRGEESEPWWRCPVFPALRGVHLVLGFRVSR